MFRAHQPYDRLRARTLGQSDMERFINICPETQARRRSTLDHVGTPYDCLTGGVMILGTRSRTRIRTVCSTSGNCRRQAISAHLRAQRQLRSDRSALAGSQSNGRKSMRKDLFVEIGYMRC